MEEDDAKDEAKETKSKEEEPIRKKGKVILTKPTKSSTIVFIRRASRSRKKMKLGEEDAEEIIFKKPPPTFQEKLKEIEGEARMGNFKSLRCETKNANEKKKVEDMMMSKLGKWKYSHDHLVQQIPNEFMQAIKPRWENTKKTTKDIYEQTLRKLMPSLR